MKRSKLVVAPDTWRVVAVDGLLIHVHEHSGQPLSSFPEEVQIRTLIGMGRWEVLAARLEVTTARLLNHEMTHGPHAQRRNEEVAAANFGILALARAHQQDVTRLMARDRQIMLDLGRAA